MDLEKTPILKSPRIKVGLTIGDPSGIGPAITVKAISKLAGSADFIIIGDLSVLKKIPNFSLLPKNGVKIIDLKKIMILVIHLLLKLQIMDYIYIINIMRN